MGRLNGYKGDRRIDLCRPYRNSGAIVANGDLVGVQKETASIDSATRRTRTRFLRLLALLLVVAVTVAGVLWRDRLGRFVAYGYPGIFLISLAANATVIFPAPSLALVFALGAVLNPILVGLVAGLGEALGELTGYLAGYSG